MERALLTWYSMPRYCLMGFFHSDVEALVLEKADVCSELVWLPAYHDVVDVA
jgi:hypothetical protein